MSNEPRFDEAEEREWEWQERARADARARDPARGEGAPGERYRELARALGALPRATLSDDFAKRVARHAELETPFRRAEPALAPFERFAIVALATGFAGIAAMAVVISGALPLIGESVRDLQIAPGYPWLAALAACLVVSALGDVRRNGLGR